MTAAIGGMRAPTVAVRRRRAGARARAKLVWAGMWGCVGIVAALVAAAAVVRPAAPDLPAAAQSVPDRAGSPSWTEIAHPLRLFTLTGPSVAQLPLDYEARRRADGSARRDILTFGSFPAAAVFLRLLVERPGPGSTDGGDLVVTAARLAASSGIAVVHAGRPDAVPTRLGLFAVRPLTLRLGPLERACLGFQLEAKVGVAGLACGPAPAELACALDGLELVTTAGNADLRAAFAEAERHGRPGCDAAAHNT